MLSMTGFGKAEIALDKLHIIVELRSLNSKYLDLSVKVPSFLKEIELKARKTIKEKLERGKVELLIHYEKNKENTAVTLNKEQISSYFKELKEISENLNIDATSNLLGHVLKLPDTIENKKEIVTNEDLGKIITCVEKAANELNHFRSQEGEALKNELQKRVSSIQKHLNSVTPFENERLPKVKSKILDAANTLNLKDQLDEKRLEQELLYYAEKLDITEEKVRLNEHCTHFLNTLAVKGSGKKLGFITQEMGREINTLGSKSHHLEIQKIVVEMKDELEKIKEQVLNVL